MNFNDFSGNGSASGDNARKMVADFLSAYDGKSEAELMDTIMKTATEYRKSGKLSDAEIDSFKSMLSPMLDRKKRAKLDEIIKAIKAIHP